MFQKTLGVMLKGGYESKTASRKLMEIHSGEPNIKIAVNQDWRLITKGMDFNAQKILLFV